MSPGETRVIDLLNWTESTQMGVMDLTGSELLACVEKFRQTRGGTSNPPFWPEVAPANIQANRVYRVGLEPDTIEYLNSATHTNPMSFRLIDVDGRAMMRNLLSERLAQPAQEQAGPK